MESPRRPGSGPKFADLTIPPSRPPRRPRIKAVPDRRSHSQRRRPSSAQRKSVRFSARTLTKTNGSLGAPAKSSVASSSSSDTDTSLSAAGEGDWAGDGGGVMGNTGDRYFSSPTDSIAGMAMFHRIIHNLEEKINKGMEK